METALFWKARFGSFRTQDFFGSFGNARNYVACSSVALAFVLLSWRFFKFFLDSSDIWFPVSTVLFLFLYIVLSVFFPKASPMLGFSFSR